jgi:hypothetical protein
MKRNKIIGGGLAVILAMLSVAACGDDAGTGPVETNQGYVGTVEGTDAFIALGVRDRATDADEAVVYVCNGDEEIAEWFNGAVEESTSFTLTNSAGATVAAALDGDGFEGEFTMVDGTVHAFTTEPITGDGGVYRTGEDAAQDLVGIWVIDNAGAERGAILMRGSFLPTTRFTVSDGTSRTFTFGGLASPVVKIVNVNGIIAPNN